MNTRHEQAYCIRDDFSESDRHFVDEWIAASKANLTDYFVSTYYPQVFDIPNPGMEERIL